MCELLIEGIIIFGKLISLSLSESNPTFECFTYPKREPTLILVNLGPSLELLFCVPNLISFPNPIFTEIFISVVYDTLSNCPNTNPIYESIFVEEFLIDFI